MRSLTLLPHMIANRRSLIGMEGEPPSRYDPVGLKASYVTAVRKVTVR